MRTGKASSWIVLASVVGGLVSGATLAGTVIDCTDDTRELQEFISGEAAPPPGETNGAPIEAVADFRAGIGAPAGDGASPKAGPPPVRRAVRRVLTKMGI